LGGAASLVLFPSPSRLVVVVPFVARHSSKVGIGSKLKSCSLFSTIFTFSKYRRVCHDPRPKVRRHREEKKTLPRGPLPPPSFSPPDAAAIAVVAPPPPPPPPPPSDTEENAAALRDVPTAPPIAAAVDASLGAKRRMRMEGWALLGGTASLVDA
jgi:hypothetical protein